MTQAEVGAVITSWSGKGPGVVVCLGWGMSAQQVRPLFHDWQTLVVGVHHPREWAGVCRQFPSDWRQIGISWGVHGMTKPGWVIAGAYAVPHPGVLRLFDRNPAAFMARFWEGYPPTSPVPTGTLREGLAWLRGAAFNATLRHRVWWHGEGDTVIPLALATQWAGALGTPLHVMPRTTHLSWLQDEGLGFQHTLSDFLSHPDGGGR